MDVEEQIGGEERRRQADRIDGDEDIGHAGHDIPGDEVGDRRGQVGHCRLGERCRPLAVFATGALVFARHRLLLGGGVAARRHLGRRRGGAL